MIFATAANAQVAAISGPTTLCGMSMGTYSDTTAGGTWTVSSTAVLTISSSGIATAVAAGVCIVSYTTGSGTATLSVTIDAPVAAISGSTTACVGASTTLTDATGGGLWSVSSTSIGSINPATGVYVGFSTGTETVTYSLASGCYTTHLVTSSSPTATLTAGGGGCAGSTGTDTLYFGASGGTPPYSYFWSPFVSGYPPYVVITPSSASVYTVTVSDAAGCTSSATASVSPTPAAISGASTVCVGAVTTLSDVTSGGVWSAATPGVGTIGATTGIVSGVSAGSETVSYSIGSCAATKSITVLPLPTVAAVSGSSSVCVGTTATLTDSSSGGVWTSTTPGVATISASGVVSGVSVGSDLISYVVTDACGVATGTLSINVSAGPTVTASYHSNICDGSGADSLMATSTSTTGSFSWAPPSGLTSTVGAGVGVVPGASGTYSVTSWDSGCSTTTTVTIDNNKIQGYITFSGAAPSALDMKVWLIQFNPIDSSIAALDSFLTCTPGGTTPDFQFLDKPAGNYMLKAKLISSVAGASGYIPTYGLSSPHWDSAATITHSTGTDSMIINMIYGTVPSGPGFIAGFVVSGAGKHTSGEVPAPNVLVYLEDAASHILTYTYTNASGEYSFSGLGYGSYIVYPTDYKYRTTPSSVITLSATADSATSIGFKEHTTLETITPFAFPAGINELSNSSNITVSPNPTNGKIAINLQNLVKGEANVIVTDLLGREVYNTVLNSNQSGTQIVDLSGLENGVYFINIHSSSMNFNKKIQVIK